MARTTTTLIDTLETLRCAIEALEPSPQQRKVKRAYNRVLRKTNTVVRRNFDLTANIGPSCGPLPTPIRPL
jgi:hypothetical protein